MFSVSALGAGEGIKIDPNIIAAGNNAFAVELYKRLGDGANDNLFFSPYSISTALALVFAGAKGQTADQMAEVLRFESEDEQLHKAFGALQKQLNEKAKAGAFKLNIANALWGQKGFDFLDEYLCTLKGNYDAPLNTVDFRDGVKREAARNEINKWVEEITNDKIADLIKPGVLDSLTRLVLVNAIYFKGDWAEKFDEKKTEQMPFYVSAEKKVMVDMMKQKEKFIYGEKDGVEVLALSYKDDKLSMYIYLPEDGSAMKQFEADLSYESLSGYRKFLRKREVIVFLPKFKMTEEFDLAGVLRAMGMPIAFSKAADFSGMTGEKGLFISNVIHKAFVEVNEEGTEAAAATAPIMGVTSMPPKPIVFKADKPFVFTIVDNESDSILFMGKLAKPKAGKK